MFRPTVLCSLLGTLITLTRAFTAPTPIVPGRSFDRLLYLVLGSADFDHVRQDVHFQELAEEGIFLDRFYALTHPSQPNYIAALAGDYFGLNHNDIVDIPEDVFTIVDLLEEGGVTWKAYLEDIPSPGYRGAYSDGSSRSGWDYMRQHNPFISFQTILRRGDRSWRLVGFNEFNEEFGAQKLPQFGFLVPNMVHSGHNSTISESMSWAHDFLKPLLKEDAFGERTLIVLTYDQSNGSQPNQVATLLLGNAIPAELKGTTDNTFYTPYSLLSTVQFNWELFNLGRYDARANVFQWAPKKGADPPAAAWNREPPNTARVNNSLSYPGPLNNEQRLRKPYPAPNLKLMGAGGKPVLNSVKNAWSGRPGAEKTPYDGTGRVFDGLHPPVIPGETHGH